MARLLLIFFLLCWNLAAQPSPLPSPQPAQQPTLPPADQAHSPPHHGERGKHRWKNLTPEERQELRKNFERWQQLSPDKKHALRERARFREERMKNDIEEAIQKSGLQLNEEQREVFAVRYRQERRKIEEKIRAEMEQRRRPMINEMIVELKKEFSTTASPTPNPE
jgi:Protein of unknown function (DUF3106)